MTEEKSTLQESKSQSTTEKSKLLISLVRMIALFGAFGVLMGLVTLFSAFSSGFSNAPLADIIFNMVYGILLIICSTVLARGKILAIWLFGGAILLSIVYSFFMGRGFNFFITAIGAFFIWQLYTLKAQGELS